MAITRIKISHPETATQLSRLNATQTNTSRDLMNKLAAWFAALAGGSRKASILISVGEASGVAASGTVTISSGSGTISATINGVASSITWATSDTNSGDLLAAAINANASALIAGVVTAANVAGVVTITAADKSVLGNCITLAASGATASGVRLTGGVDCVFTTHNRGF